MEYSAFAIKNLELTNYFLLSKVEQLQILQWRNHPSVRNVFFQQQMISETTHFNFVHSLKTDETRRYWMVKYNGENIGSLDLYNIDSTSCYWGFFLAPHKQKSALGVLLEFVVLEIVFEQMGLATLRCETLDFNDGVLRMHHQFGFREARREGNRVIMEISNADWQSAKGELEQLVELLLR